MRTATVIGNLASAHDVLVDRRGMVVSPAGVTLDWLIGAADRWHLPDQERGTAVMQRRIDGTPVVETSLRVPSGSIVHRAWCVADPGRGDVVVVEVENRSRDAVAAAFAVRGDGGSRVSFDGERAIEIGGRPPIVLGRVPARVSSGDQRSIRDIVTAGEAPATAPFDSAPAGAFVFPLAHTARLRVALSLRDGSPSTDLDRFPDAEQVARGWRGHVDAGVRVALPDAGLSESLVAARTSLLIRSGQRLPTVEAAIAGMALDEWGHHDASAALLAGLVDRQRLDGLFGRRKNSTLTAAVVSAWGFHARVTGAAEFAETLAEPIARAAHRLGRQRRRGGRPAWFATVQRDAADLLDVAGQPEAAALCRERAAACPPALFETTIDPALVFALAPEAAGTDVTAIARFLDAASRLLVDDLQPSEIRVLPAFPADWLGREVEGHRLPTRAGLVSFAIRWHGARPAILWEVEGAHGSSISVPGLDPTWATTEPAGEALLQPVEPAGGLPKVVAPLRGKGTAVHDVPGDGGNFQ